MHKSFNQLIIEKKEIEKQIDELNRLYDIAKSFINDMVYESNKEYTTHEKICLLKKSVCVAFVDKYFGENKEVRDSNLEILIYLMKNIHDLIQEAKKLNKEDFYTFFEVYDYLSPSDYIMRYSKYGERVGTSSGYEFYVSWKRS